MSELWKNWNLYTRDETHHIRNPVKPLHPEAIWAQLFPSWMFRLCVSNPRQNAWHWSLIFHAGCFCKADFQAVGIKSDKNSDIFTTMEIFKHFEFKYDTLHSLNYALGFWRSLILLLIYWTHCNVISWQARQSETPLRFDPSRIQWDHDHTWSDIFSDNSFRLSHHVSTILPQPNRVSFFKMARPGWWVNPLVGSVPYSEGDD